MMASAKKTSPEKKPKATPNANPFGLTTRDIEIMIYAWKCLDEMGKVSKDQKRVPAQIPNHARNTKPQT